jgi:hypothetical protein
VLAGAGVGRRQGGADHSHPLKANDPRSKRVPRDSGKMPAVFVAAQLQQIPDATLLRYAGSAVRRSENHISDAPK